MQRLEGLGKQGPFKELKGSQPSCSASWKRMQGLDHTRFLGPCLEMESHCSALCRSQGRQWGGRVDMGRHVRGPGKESR